MALGSAARPVARLVLRALGARRAAVRDEAPSGSARWRRARSGRQRTSPARSPVRPGTSPPHGGRPPASTVRGSRVGRRDLFPAPGQRPAGPGRSRYATTAGPVGREVRPRAPAPARGRKPAAVGQGDGERGGPYSVERHGEVTNRRLRHVAEELERQVQPVGRHEPRARSRRHELRQPPSQHGWQADCQEQLACLRAHGTEPSAPASPASASRVRSVLIASSSVGAG